MFYRGRRIYGRSEREIRTDLESRVDVENVVSLDVENVVSLDVDIHTHGLWQDYHQGFLNLELAPRYAGYLARVIKDKGLDICGIADTQSHRISEKRFKTLLRSADKTGEHYDFKFNERTATMFFDIEGKTIAIPRVQEVVTNRNNRHFLAINLPYNVNVPGGMTPQDTCKFIKDHGGYVQANHPYFLWAGKRVVEMCRGDIDFLEYSGFFDTKAKVFPYAALVGALTLACSGNYDPACYLGAIGLASFAKPLGVCNWLVERRAPVLDLAINGSSDAHREKDIGRTRTRVYMPRDQAEDKENWVSSAMEGILAGNHQVYTETGSISSLFLHEFLLRYFHLRDKLRLLDDFTEEERVANC